ncbi:CIA30 family protein [Polaribacter sp. Hel1_85]|uniref:CIA30 family protein n=1 Tax=Polaribacter sp. Hel1_85 TaxID=1250005 RepID=UPI00055FFC12|nr:CIA30 family protein [Polaribacter sp. Hel1_85]
MSDTKNVIFDFKENSNISDWLVVDDVVMGGKSNGSFKINNHGYGEYSGLVSLENNGGFSSLRYRFKQLKIENFTNVVVRIKGDGNKYQFRIKDDFSNSYSYVYTFLTMNNEWQNIIIPLKEMYPAFRGRKLDMNNFSANKIHQIAFLIGNKIQQKFKLEIDIIYLQ